VQVADGVGLLVLQVHLQDVGEQVVVAVPRRRSSSGTRNRLPRSRASSIALPPSRPVTASHSGPVSRLRIEVCSRKLRTCSGWRCRTSSTR
jgi:hypothetical protein